MKQSPLRTKNFSIFFNYNEIRSYVSFSALFEDSLFV